MQCYILFILEGYLLTEVRVSGEGCHGIHKRRRTICESDVSVTSWNAGKGVGGDYEEYCGIIAHIP